MIYGYQYLMNKDFDVFYSNLNKSLLVRVFNTLGVNFRTLVSLKKLKKKIVN